MIFWIIGVLIGAFIALYWLHDQKKDVLFSILMTFSCSFVGLLFGVLISLVVGMVLPKTHVLENQIELIAVQDNSLSRTQTRLFLIGVNLEQEERFYYLFYQKEGDRIKFGKVPVDKTTIYEEERNNGLMKVYREKIASSGSILNLLGAYGILYWDEKYEIFVPQGSVIRKFQLDLN